MLFSLRKVHHFSTQVLRPSSDFFQELIIFADRFIKNAQLNAEVQSRSKLLFIDSLLCSQTGLKTLSDFYFPISMECDEISYKYADISTPYFSRFLGSLKPISKAPSPKAVLMSCILQEQWRNYGVFLDYKGKKSQFLSYCDGYPVVISAFHQRKWVSGLLLLRSLVLMDEIRGKLFKNLRFGPPGAENMLASAISSIITYGVLQSMPPFKLEQAILLYLSQYFPYNCELYEGNAKGLPFTMAFHYESFMNCVNRAGLGLVVGDLKEFCDSFFEFYGGNLFRSEEITFSTKNNSEFCTMDAHFVLGVYKFCLGSVIEGVIKILLENKAILEKIQEINCVNIIGYGEIFEILKECMISPGSSREAIGSLPFIVSILLKKTRNMRNPDKIRSFEDMWKALMLGPMDFANINSTSMRNLGNFEIKLEKGQENYEEKHPESLPVRVIFDLKDGSHLDSGLIVYPAGHSKNTTANLEVLLKHKFELMGESAFNNQEIYEKVLTKLMNLQNWERMDVLNVYNFEDY